jgi:N,N'-diacetyllegionaminate synthase
MFLTQLKKRVLVIAEIGINHNGNIEIAKKLIDKAKFCGADVVKFQIYNLKNFLSKNFTHLNKEKKKSFFNMKNILKKNMLTYKQFKILRNYCHSKNIKFAATPFDLESYFFLKKLNPYFVKLASADLNNFELLNKISKTKTRLILSTGMSNKSEIDLTINYLKKQKFNKYTIMHCVSVYPTPIRLINLKSITFLRKNYKCHVGLSDHSININIPVYAAILGASVIEKHFTLNQNMKGPDHKSSLNPNGFIKMVKKIRQLDEILGKENKKKNTLEIKNEWIAKRSIYAKINIKKGEKFTSKNIFFLRPQISTQKIDKFKIYNFKAKKNFLKGELII